jgi:leader peptidase (prepilin peptidase)/N-methyltransferase
MTPLAIILFAALVGLCAGSFIATAAIRFTKGAGYIAGRSYCDGCGQGLGFSETLPVFAYISQRGSARCCNATIDPLHLVGEIGGAGIALVAVWAGSWLSGLVLAGLGAVLLTLALIDLKTGRLPDRLVAAVAILSLVTAVLAGEDRLLVGTAAAGLSFLILEGVRRGFFRLRRRGGLGFGDVKLVSALALALGALTPFAVVLACSLGLVQAIVFRPGDGRIAFGPAIALAGFATLAAQSIGGLSL